MGIDKEQILQQLIKLVMGLFSKEDKIKEFIPTPNPDLLKETESVIDWTNPQCHITEHFTVQDACMLHGYNRLATETDGMNKNMLITLCNKMEEVRAILGVPMDIHCMYRSEAYNQSQNITPVKDVHSMNLAVDFDCGPELTIDQVKNKLEPQLENFNIRMEKGTTTWVHLDLRQPGVSGRYFTP